MNSNSQCDVTKYDWGLTQLHEKLLEILVDISGFCDRNGIKFCLAYGTVLGAVRHSGFIPWDDDADIYMTVDDYTIFKKKMRSDKILSQKYYLQELDAIDGMVELPKIRMNMTTFIEDCYSEKNMHHGVYIDIFLLHNAAKNKIGMCQQYIFNLYLLAKGLSNKKYNRKFGSVLSILKKLPYNFMRRKSLSIVYKYDNTTSNFFFDSDIRSFKKSFYSKEMIFPTTLKLFEGIQLPIPNSYDAYLTSLYGNYLELPNFEQIKSNQHAHVWDVNKDYSEYLPFVTDFSDEFKGK